MLLLTVENVQRDDDIDRYLQMMYLLLSSYHGDVDIKNLSSAVRSQKISTLFLWLYRCVKFEYTVFMPFMKEKTLYLKFTLSTHEYLFGLEYNLISLKL